MSLDKAIEHGKEKRKPYRGAKAIDAVLNFEQHKYLFFCAKADFSGTHNYAATYAEHSRNARAYQKALDKRLKEQKAKK